MASNDYVIKRIDRLFDKSLYSQVISEYHLNKSNIDVKYTDEIYYKLIVSCYRVKNFAKVIEISKIINKLYLNNNYLLCEMLGESYYQLNHIKQAFKYFETAVSIRPSLKSAWQRYLLLKFRITKNLEKEELDKGLSIAIKNKKEMWLRDLSYLFYSLNYFQESNYCLEKLVEFNFSLNYIDQLTYSLRGINDNNNNVSLLIENRERELFQFKHIHKENKKLVITLSPNDKYMFQGYKFDEKCDLLHILDKTASYYVFIYKDLVELINNIVKKCKYDEVVLVGSSKGGTGVLITYIELKEILTIPIRCIAFSPQISIYPFNKNLTIPSYQRFINLCEINPIASQILVDTPKINSIKVRSIDNIKVIYGYGFKMDRIEAQYLFDNKDIDLEKLDYNGHTTSIPYTIPDGKSYSDLQTTYSNLKYLQDEDFQALDGGKTIDIIDQIWKLYIDPNISLNQIL